MGRVRSRLVLTALIGAASVASVLGTAADASTPTARPTLHTAVEAVIAVLALLAAFLAAVRARATTRLDDLILAAALGVLASAHVLYTLLPAALDGYSFAWQWSADLGHLLGAGFLSVAAVMPAQRTADPRRAAILLAAGSALALAAVAAGMHAAEPVLERESTGERELGRPLIGDVVHFATMVLFATAAVAFLRRRAHWPIARWIAVAAGVAAVVRFDFLVNPATGLSAVRAGDALRALVYLLIVFALVRDAATRTADAAARAERRRIARDLHDGLAQELAFIARRARSTDGDAELAQAAERALYESREAIAALRRPDGVSLEVALASAVDGIAARAGARLELDLAPVQSLSPAERDALVAIAREAVVNAARHAGAEVVRVELAEHEGVRLRVVDDGSGFDPSARRRRGFGLEGMRERAEAIGAALRITSRPGGGTEVEVVLP